MARFYQPPKQGLVEGGIFQPNWELAQKSFGKQDQDIGDIVDTLSIMDVPAFEYNKMADEESAKMIKNKYEESIDDLTKSILSDVGNTTKNKRKLAEFNRTIKKDMESGDISKLQDHKKSIDKYIESFGGLKSKGEASKFGSLLNDYYKSANGEGALTNPFNGPDVVSMEGLTFNSYLGSDYYKSLVSDKNGKAYVRDDGTKLMNVSGSLEELTPDRIAASYLGYLNDNQDYDIRSQIGEMLPGEKGRWQGNVAEMQDITDSNGNVVGQRIVPNTDHILGESLAFGMESIPWSKRENKEVFAAHNQAYKERLALNRKKKEIDYENPPGWDPSIDITEFMGQDEYVKEATNGYIEKLKEQLMSSFKGTDDEKRSQWNAVSDNFKDIGSIENFAKNAGLTNLAATAGLFKEMVDNKAGWDKIKIQGGLSNPEVKALRNNIDAEVETQVNNGKMKLTLAKNYVFDTPVNMGETSTKINMTEQLGGDFNALSSVGKIINNPWGEKVKIVNVTYQKRSLNPIVRNMTSINNVGIENNHGLIEVKFETVPFDVSSEVSTNSDGTTSISLDTGSDEDTKNSFTLSAYVDMNQPGGGVSFRGY